MTSPAADPHIQISKPPSPINLIKRPRIKKATLPNLIHHPHRLHIIPTTRPRRHTQRRPPPHTLLHLLRQFPLVAREKLPRPPALPAQRARSDLHARRVPQVERLELEAHVVVGVHHLVRECIFQVPAVPQLVRADEDAVVLIKPP